MWSYKLTLDHIRYNVGGQFVFRVLLEIFAGGLVLYSYQTLAFKDSLKDVKARFFLFSLVSAAPCPRDYVL